MDEKIITVTGQGDLHIVPDVTRLDLTLQSLHDSYEEAYAQAKGNTEKISKIMNEVGLDKTMPKTIRFDIDKKTKTEYDKFGHYKNEVFIGFGVDHRVRIDLGMDNVLLNKIVKLIGQHLKHAEINIGHTVKDTRPAQLKMLERAVKDAREKATIMTAACGCSLGDVKRIDFSIQEIEIYTQVRQIKEATEACACEPEGLDITPADLAASENVTIMWYIVNNAAQQ